MPSFSELGLPEALAKTLSELGYEQPTPIQEQAIPVLLGGADVIGQAQTGTGKTAAFGLPLLTTIDPAQPDVQALVLTPTRELCIQVTQALRTYGASLGIDVVGIFGGAPIRSQMAQLKTGGHVVVGTVGRVLDLMSRNSLVLHSARYVVLDEADEMLDLGFLEDVQRILNACPNGRQTALFSATMPDEIKRLADSYMYEPQTIKVQAPTLTIDTVEHFFIECSRREKPEVLAKLIDAERPHQVIIFVRTKIGVDRLTRELDRTNPKLGVKALHGDMSQGARDGVMIGFKNARVTVLVATDIAARGLDIEHVTHVINYDVPNSPEIYVHRIGRTGRVGRTGRAISLIEPSERDALEGIERHTKMSFSPWSAGDAGDASAARKPRARKDAAADAAAKVKAVADDDGKIVATPDVSEITPGVSKATPDAIDSTGHGEPVPAEAEIEAEPKAAVKKPVRRSAAAARQARDSEPARAEPRRPRHTKPTDTRVDLGEAGVTLLFDVGTRDGATDGDLVRVLTGADGLRNDQIRNVRVLERCSFARVPGDRAVDAAAKATGATIGDRPIKVGAIVGKQPA